VFECSALVARHSVRQCKDGTKQGLGDATSANPLIDGNTRQPENGKWMGGQTFAFALEKPAIAIGEPGRAEPVRSNSEAATVANPRISPASPIAM
jgi:hypothetical protein